MDAVNELLAHIRGTRGRLSPMLKRVERFHNANPYVLDFLVRELYEVREIGWPGASVISLWEHGRWVITKGKVAGDPYAMNNNLRSYYARVIVILHPDLNGFFEMREPQEASRKEHGPDAEMGTKLAPAKTNAKDYGRRLLWAHGREIEQGWRPSVPHVPQPVARRERVRRKPVAFVAS